MVVSKGWPLEAVDVVSSLARSIQFVGVGVGMRCRRGLHVIFFVIFAMEDDCPAWWEGRSMMWVEIVCFEEEAAK